MKLIFCESCQDVVRLQQDYIRACKCGRSGGIYEEDGLHAHYWGVYAKPIGFANSSLRLALDSQPREGRGKIFEAFVIPHRCETFEWHSDSPTLASESYGEAFLAALHKKYAF